MLRAYKNSQGDVFHTSGILVLQHFHRKTNILSVLTGHREYPEYRKCMKSDGWTAPEHAKQTS